MTDLDTLGRDYQHLHDLLRQLKDDAVLDAFTSKVVLYVDPQNQTIVDMNEVALEVLGYSREDLLQRSIDDLESEILGDSLRSYYEVPSEIYEYECQYRHAKGYTLPIYAEKRIISRPQGLLIRYTLQDMSLHKQFAHEFLRRADNNSEFNEKLKILNEINLDLGRMDSFDAVCQRSVALGIERLGFERLSLWFLEPDGQKMRGTFGVDEQGNLRDERAETWYYESTFIIDFINGRREARIQTDAPIYNEKTEILDYGWHVSAPIVNGEKFIGYIATDNFITRQKMHNYQPELLRLYGATVGHHAAQQREQELIQQLRQQELDLRLEQERIHVLENFVRDIGHEFRTPLSVISTNNYLIRKQERKDDALKYHHQITEQLAYLKKLINDMLHIVKLGSIEPIKRRTVNLGNLIDKLVANFELEQAAKQIVWELDSTPDVFIQGNEELLQRAIYEIMHNALQFSPQGATVRIALVTGEKSIQLTVQDWGIGIAPEQKERVWQRFYRIDEARTLRGAGLGLSIAKLIVETHQGQISLESELGKGSIFTIQL